MEVELLTLALVLKLAAAIKLFVGLAVVLAPVHALAPARAVDGHVLSARDGRDACHEHRRLAVGRPVALVQVAPHLVAARVGLEGAGPRREAAARRHGLAAPRARPAGMGRAGAGAISER